MRRASSMDRMEVAQARRAAWLMGAAVLLTMAASCGEAGDEGPGAPGSLSLAWRVSPQGCADSGVTHIQVGLEAAEGRGSEQIIYECGARRALIEDLLPGAYDITLLGLDGSGAAIFETVTQRIGVASQRVTSLEEQRLTARPAVLDVGWFFANSRLCSSNGVERVIVGVYDADAYAIGEVEFACELGTGTVSDLQSGGYLVEVIGLSPEGKSIFRGLSSVELGRGERRTVEVPMEVCEGDC